MRMNLIIPAAMLALSLTGSTTAQAGVALESLDARWARTAVAGAAALEAQNPELANAIRTAQPRLSRSGAPLFINPTWYTPEAASAILVRIAEGNDTSAERVALLDALSRTGGTWVPAVAALLAHETDASVRRMMVELMRDAPTDTARSVVETALQDKAPEVRSAALRVIGFHKAGRDLAPMALPSLADEQASLRSDAARYIGYAGYTDGFESIRPLLADADAEVRFRALRSLEKLDTVRTQQLIELAQLAVDPDVKVARVAQKLQAQ